MLKTNSKKVIDSVIGHCLDYYDSDSVALLGDCKAALAGRGRGCFSWYNAGLALVEGGGLLCYYSQARDFLRDVLDETQAESDRFDDCAVWRLYCHLVGRAVEKIAKNTEGV